MGGQMQVMLVLIFSLGINSFAAQKPQRIRSGAIASIETPELAVEYALLDEGHFEHQYMVAYSLDFIQRHTQGIQLIYFSTDRDELFRYRAKGVSRSDLFAVRNRIALIGMSQAIPPRIAQMICVGENCLLRSRNRDHLDFSMLRGKRGSAMSAWIGEKSELLHIDYENPIGTSGPDGEKERSVLRCGGCIGGVTFFIKIAHFESFQKSCRAGAEQLRAATGWKGALYVVLRGDSWFADHPGFPLAYAFDEEPSVPTGELWERGTIGSCALMPLKRADHK